MSSHVPILIHPGVPSGLEHLADMAFLQVADMPKDVLSHLPAETTSVSALLETNLPDRLAETAIIPPVHLCSSSSGPCWEIDELFKTRVPPRTWLYELQRALNGMWVTGTRSVRPPSTSNPNLRFPLWVVNFWYTAVEIVEQRDKWRAAVDWMLNRVQDSEI